MYLDRFAAHGQDVLAPEDAAAVGVARAAVRMSARRDPLFAITKFLSRIDTKARPFSKH